MSKRSAWIALACATIGFLHGAWRFRTAMGEEEEREALQSRVEVLEATARKIEMAGIQEVLARFPDSQNDFTPWRFEPDATSSAPSSATARPPAGGSSATTQGSPGESPLPLWTPAPAGSKAEELYRASISAPSPKDIEALEEAVRLEPQNPKYRAALIARLMDDRASWPRARSELELLNGIDRENALAPWLLAQIAFESGDIAGGRAWAEQAMARSTIRMYAMDEAEARLANLLAEKPDAGPESIMTCLFETRLPALASIRNVTRQMIEASGEALAAGNLDEANRLADSATAFTRQLSGQPAFHIDELVSISLHSEGLKAARRVAEARQDEPALAAIDRDLARIALQRDLCSRVIQHTEYVFTSGGLSPADVREYARLIIQRGEGGAALGLEPRRQGR